jgi:hypothetical protein
MSVITCPTDCSGLPCVEFDDCAPSLHYGEIAKIYFTSSAGDDFNNWDQLGEWTTRLADCAGDEDSIRTLVVIGELVEPEGSEIRISGNRRIVPIKTYKINFTVHETNDVNYDMVRYFECNLKNKVWFETNDGMLYGGNSGVSGSFKLNNIIPLSYQELNVYQGTFTWEDNMLPERCISPMA